MKSRLATTLVAVYGAAAAFGADRSAVQRGPGRLNMGQMQTVTGTVTSIDLGYAATYPSITVNQTVVKVAPVWFFLEQQFELSAGDSVSVPAAPCWQSGDPYLYAIAITNLATAESVTLRDSSGFPLWSGMGNGRSRGPVAAVRYVDPGTVRTISGIVERVTLGAGIQMPALVVRTADGRLEAVKIGPERVLLAADFELNPGEPVTVTLARCGQENVALQLTNAAGITITLRNSDGSAGWR